MNGNALLYSIIATAIVSAISLIGALAFVLRYEVLNKFLFYLVAVSAGSLMGSAFLHLIPEALEQTSDGYEPEKIFAAVLIGFAVFFIMERVLHWHHCHHKHDSGLHAHPFTYLNLVGDGFHNFIDGVVIAAAFSLNWQLGIVTTIGVIAHEIPQEISDFGVLIYGGLSKKRALFYNFICGSLAVIGAVFGIFLAKTTVNMIPFMVSLTAGGFIYVSGSDLIPELHKEPKLSKAILAFLSFFAGVGIMVALKFIEA